MSQPTALKLKKELKKSSSPARAQEKILLDKIIL